MLLERRGGDGWQFFTKVGENSWNQHNVVQLGQ